MVAAVVMLDVHIAGRWATTHGAARTVAVAKMLPTDDGKATAAVLMVAVAIGVEGVRSLTMITMEATTWRMTSDVGASTTSIV